MLRPGLNHVGHLHHGVQIANVHQLGHDRQPGLLLGLGQQPQAGFTQALEGVGRGAGLYAPPRSICAPASRTVRAADSSTSRDSTVQGPAIVAK